MREEYRAKRQIVLDGLAGCPVLRLIEPQGAFYAFVDVRLTGLDSGEFADLLLDEEHVAVVPGEAFGEEGRGFVRLSYAGDAASCVRASPSARIRRTGMEPHHRPPHRHLSPHGGVGLRLGREFRLVGASDGLLVILGALEHFLGPRVDALLLGA